MNQESILFLSFFLPRVRISKENVNTHSKSGILTLSDSMDIAFSSAGSDDHNTRRRKGSTDGCSFSFGGIFLVFNFYFYFWYH